MSRSSGSDRVILTPRDLALLSSLAEHRYLACSQLERLHFVSPQTARRRVRLLEQAGLVRLIDAPGVEERVATLGQAGAAALGSAAGRSSVDRRPGGRPQNPLFLRHHLACAEFRLRLGAECGARTDLRVAGYLPEHLMHKTGSGAPVKYLRDGVPAPAGEPGLTHCPDAVFALTRAERSALFFLELDRGTEVLSSAQHGVGKIVRFYLRYLLSGGFERYRADFGVGHDFRAFRLLFVTTTRERLENIRRSCGRIPFEPAAARRFIWLATDTVLEEDGLLRHAWSSLDPRDGAQYHLAPPEGA
ncbi:MAG: replication-relaxation family protein [Candidatus Eisenbacteria bacterium]